MLLSGGLQATPLRLGLPWRHPAAWGSAGKGWGAGWLASWLGLALGFGGLWLAYGLVYGSGLASGLAWLGLAGLLCSLCLIMAWLDSYMHKSFVTFFFFFNFWGSFAIFMRSGDVFLGLPWDSMRLLLGFLAA